MQQSVSMRTVARQHKAHRDDIQDLTTRRPLPGPGLDQVDPFLILNHHGPQVYPPGNNGMPFGPHPHRGFETVTFILQGTLAHFDTGGHESVIEAGGVQWMTAGSGLVHNEVTPQSFKDSGGPLEVLQLWVNLPPELKMTPPRYTGLQRDAIPALPIAHGRGVLNLISGTFDGVEGPIHSLTGIFMSTVRLEAGADATLPAPRGRNVFLYVVSGNVNVAGAAVEPWKLVTMNDDGDAIAIAAQSDSLLLYGHGKPIGAPVVQYGPFVMNTENEIREAIRDYQAGKFNGDGKLLEVGT